MAAFSTLQDNFDGASLDTTNRWTNVFGTVAQTGGVVKLTTPNLTSGYSGFDSLNHFDLTGSYIFAQMVNAGNLSLAGVENYGIQAVKDGSNVLAWYMNSNNISARTVIAGSGVQHNTVAYDSTIHKWLRIRESGGTCFWDYSQDGIYWNNFYSVANPFAITSLVHEFSYGDFNTGEATSTAIFDNFNIQMGINDMLMMFR